MIEQSKKSVPACAPEARYFCCVNETSQDSPLSGTAGGAAAHGAGAGAGPGGDVTATGGYERGVFVRAARGSSIDVGLFHDDQRRSVATVEIWVNAGEQVKPFFFALRFRSGGGWFGRRR